MRLLVLVVLLTSTAFAEGRLAINAAGGIEGGTITGEPRPDGVLEIGGIVEWVLPGRNLGFGATTTVVQRLTDTGPYDEMRFDATVRFVRSDRKFRVGAGVGLRQRVHQDTREHVTGYDFIYLDGAMRVAGTETFGVDFFYAWAFGCYSDTITVPASGDMLPPKKHIRCGDSLSTTYTLGIATSFSWR